VVAGTGLVVTTLLQGAVSGADIYGLRLGVLGDLAGAVLGVALNTALFTYLFRRLTVRELGFQDVIVGAAVAAIAWLVLQKVGTGLVNNKIAGARGTYGTFALVIGLLFWSTCSPRSPCTARSSTPCSPGACGHAAWKV